MAWHIDLQRLPTVLTHQEVKPLLGALDGVSWIVAMLLYGSGLRVTECLRLCVKDIDFVRREILVRQGKGNKDRVTTLEMPRLRDNPTTRKGIEDHETGKGQGR